MHVVICGGGVIGACTAYFLARRGVEVTVVERTEVACAASGKAGGFLALDWCGGSPLDTLARRKHSDIMLGVRLDQHGNSNEGVQDDDKKDCSDYGYRIDDDCRKFDDRDL